MARNACQMSGDDSHAVGTASAGLIEHLLSEIRDLRDTVSKLTSPKSHVAVVSVPPLSAFLVPAPSASSAHAVSAAHVSPVAAAAASLPPKRTGDQVPLAERLAAQTQMLFALPAALRPKTVPIYYLPWMVQYARRLFEGHQPFGIEEQEGAAGDTAAGGSRGGGDHVLIVKQWSDMFEAALVKHLSEDRFDTVNLQM